MRQRNQPVLSTVKRTATWLAITVLAATTTMVTAAGPSSAATVPTSITAYGPGGKFGYAHFDADTNVLSIHDSHADGYGIAVENRRSDLANPGPYWGYNRDGNGTTTYYQLHMPSLASISFRLCGEQDGIAIWSDCGEWVVGYSGTEI